MGEVLDAGAVRRWSRLAADALGRTRVEIDALNVFPVPDGDTGTNLHLTALAAAEAVDGLPDGADTVTAWRALAKGALFGARGNSGVIFSQMLRGMADVLGAGGGLAEALRHASDLAYRAVAHPVEGTMLSVLRAAGEDCPEEGEPGAVARAMATRARSALRETTGRLEVLTRNGVVDAGAAGLCVVLDALAAVAGAEYPQTYEVPPREPGAEPGAPEGRDEDAGGGFEVMYLLDAAEEAVPALRTGLDGLGDSVVVVGGEGVWNVHVHTDDAGAAIEAGMRAGRPYRVRVTCLRPHDGRRAPATGRGVVAVTVGDGLTALFADHGAVTVRREPGQVPSLDELARAITRAGDEVIVLANDEAVVRVAEAAALPARDGGARVAVPPVKASVQGLAALAVHDPMRGFGEDVIAMTHAAGATRSGRVEIAAGEAVTSAGICRPGDRLGLIDGDVAVIGDDLAGVAVRVLDRMLSGGGELVTLITGGDATDGLEEAVRRHLRARHPHVDVVAYGGGPDRYPLLVGVE